MDVRSSSEPSSEGGRQRRSCTCLRRGSREQKGRGGALSNTAERLKRSGCSRPWERKSEMEGLLALGPRTSSFTSLGPQFPHLESGCNNNIHLPGFI